MADQEEEEEEDYHKSTPTSSVSNSVLTTLFRLEFGYGVLDDDAHMLQGYLRDEVAVLADDRSKRRRVLTEGTDDIGKLFHELWNWDFHEDLLADLNSFSDPKTKIHDHPFGNSLSFKQLDSSPSPSSSQKDYHVRRGEEESKEENNQKRRKEELVMGRTLVYTFTVVKPGGIEGDITLDDINRRLCRRPTRSVRHPVGEFACSPCVSATNMAGLSGKDVVGLVRIRTNQGCGSITVIKTRR